MSTQEQEHDPVRVKVQNIGGISETEVTFSPGVTIFAGRNATNRTSFLQAIMAALGSNQVSVKGDADEGSVELILEGTKYTRKLTNNNGEIITEGDPYLDDSTLADLFAFLLETNEARQTVAQKGDLRELIMRPIDTEKIQAEINQLQNRKQNLDQQLDELNSLERKLPKLESERANLEDQIKEKRSKLEAKEEEIDETDASITGSRENKEELEQALNKLQSTRSNLEDVRYQLETQKNSLEALEEEKNDLKNEQENLPDSVEEEISERDSKIDELRQDRRKVSATISELQTIIEFNERMLEGTSSEIREALRGENQDGDVTNRLLQDSKNVTCWTCGSSVDKSEVEGTLETLQALRQEKAGKREELSKQIDELQSEQSTLKEQRKKRQRIDQRRQEIQKEQEERKSTIETLKQERQELQEKIETVEQLVEDLEHDIQTEVLEQHREANELEFEIEQFESELEEVESEISEIESQLDDRTKLQNQRTEVQEKLENLRTRIDRIEQEAVEEFNHHMSEVLNLLEYANLERIWIERSELEVREGRRKTTKPTFDLHIIRSTDEGVTYEDTIEHLSESEREVTGLIFALSGFLVHDVHEILPVLLLDSLEALDSGRLAELVDYLQTYSEYLLIALLPDDAAAMDDQYERVTEI